MKSRWAALILGALMAAAVACSSGDKPSAVEGEATGNAAGKEQRNGGEKAIKRGSVKLPRPGAYVYDFHGRGPTDVPDGTQTMDEISSSEDLVVTDFSNNRNSNTRRFEHRWEEKRILWLSTETKTSAGRSPCIFDPPVEVLHFPLRAETFPKQKLEGEGSGCGGGTLEVEVIGQEEVADATGRKWVTWRIETEVRSEGTTKETHWFSPQLGKDVRIRTSAVAQGIRNETEQVLRDYPS